MERRNMSKFRYYIVTTDTGDVHGSDEYDVVKDFLPDEMTYVIDTWTGKWLIQGSEEEIIDIKEAQ
jgi:hypothetical protein